MTTHTPDLPWNLSIQNIRTLIEIDSNATMSVVTPVRPFGGYTGEKTLIDISAPGISSTQVLLKRVSQEEAHREMHAYQALTDVGAPIVICYGLHDRLESHAVLAVEYLPDAIAWPISSERHLAWATATAQLARCPVPQTVKLPYFRFLPMHDALPQRM